MTGILIGSNSYPLKDISRLEETRHIVSNPVPNIIQKVLYKSSVE